MEKSKKIGEEFGLASEAEAVKEYSLLNKDIMYPNYPLIASELILTLNLNQVRIVDIGTGLGSLAFEFAKRLTSSKVYGIDISGDMLKEAKSRKVRENISNVEFKRADAQRLGFEDNFFDLVVSFGVLHHIKDIKKVFLEITRVLKAGAVAFIYDLRKDAPEEVVSEIAKHMPSLQSKAFLESVKEACEISYLENILSSLNIKEYTLSYPKFSRKALIENKDILRMSKFMSREFNKLLVQIKITK